MNTDKRLSFNEHWEWQLRVGQHPHAVARLDETAKWDAWAIWQAATTRYQQENNMYYEEKTIGQFTLGKVVRFVKGTTKGAIGHVVGFTANSTDELIISVKLACDQSVRDIHPCNLEVL